MENNAADHSDAMLYIFNGGAMLVIVSLFVHLIRVTIPKKDQEQLSMLTEQAKAHREATAELIREFREDIKLERDSHDKEINKITSSVDKLADNLQRLIERNSRG